jgi:hypothetical protein
MFDFHETCVNAYVRIIKVVPLNSKHCDFTWQSVKLLKNPTTHARLTSLNLTLYKMPGKKTNDFLTCVTKVRKKVK